MPTNRDIDIGLLRTFLTVAECGSMTIAAHILNLTQAAVSQQIKRLETLLQKPVFDRTTKQISLSDEGERLLGHARRMVKLNDEVWTTMTAPGFEGEVRLGVPNDIIHVFMPEILRSFHHRWPGIQVTFFCDATVKLLALLRKGEIDLTLTTECTRGDDLLLVDQLVWIQRIGGQAARSTPLPVSMGAPECSFRAAAAQALSESGHDWKLICHSGHLEPVYTTLEADLAVAIFLSQCMPPNTEIVPASAGLPMLPPFYVNLHTQAVAKNPLVDELANHIRRGFMNRYQRAA
ncbi:MAG: LysR family transcriptional regulator [Pseudomonadota bacterium]